MLTLRDANGAVIEKTKVISNDPNQSSHGLTVNLTRDTGVMTITAGLVLTPHGPGKTDGPRELAPRATCVQHRH